MQAAIGRIQYRKLPDWRRQRTENAEFLSDLLDQIPGVRVPRPAGGETLAYYRLYARLDLSMLADGWDRDRVIAEMTARGTPGYSGSCTEVYRERAFGDAAMAPWKPLPRAVERGEDVMAFLVHPGLTEADLRSAAATLRDSLLTGAKVDPH